MSIRCCSFDDIPKAFGQGMSELCNLHSKTGVGESGEYLPPLIDRQVGLGMLGLANLLALEELLALEAGLPGELRPWSCR